MIIDAAWSLLYVVYISLLSLFFEWLDRKFVARLQNRVGPRYAGPSGLLQPLADLIKLLSKEDIIPVATDEFLFTAMPIILALLPVLAGIFIPFLGESSLVSLEGDLIIVLGLLGMYVVMVYMAGIAPPSRYSLLGAERAALMMVSFEIPMMLSCLSIAMIKGSLTLSYIATNHAFDQSTIAIGLPAFIIFVLSAQAELERIPFDIPEAKTEIVAGWQVEYSSWRLAFIRFSMDVEHVVLAGLGAALFLGGGSGPSPQGLEWLLQPLYFLAKSIFMLFIFSLLKASFARVRIDQVAGFCWRVLIPASLILLIVTRWVV